MLAATLIDLNAMQLAYNSEPANFTELNGVLLFSAASVTSQQTGAVDRELWRSDGTDAATLQRELRVPTLAS